MNQSFHLKTPEIRSNCIAYIALLDHLGDTVVTVKDGKQTRSDAQHRLRWLWMEHLAKELSGQGKGRDKYAWNMAMKHRYMPEILIAQDEDYADVFSTYNETCGILTGAHKEKYQRQFWDKVISTKDMTVESMAKWLDMVDKDAQRMGVTLPVPEDLHWAR